MNFKEWLIDSLFKARNAKNIPENNWLYMSDFHNINGDFLATFLDMYDANPGRGHITHIRYFYTDHDEFIDIHASNWIYLIKIEVDSDFNIKSIYKEKVTA
jgi:hypothetical protein